MRMKKEQEQEEEEKDVGVFISPLRSKEKQNLLRMAGTSIWKARLANSSITTSISFIRPNNRRCQPRRG